MKRFGVMRMLIVAAAFGCGFGSFESDFSRDLAFALSQSLTWAIKISCLIAER